MPVKREAPSRKRRAAGSAAEVDRGKAIRPSPSAAARDETSSLPASVVAVRLVWVDFSGIRRCRVIPASRWPAVASGASPVRLARACVALQTTMDAATPPTTREGGSVVDAAGVVGDVVLSPVTRPATVPWHRNHAVCLCELRKLPDPEEEGMERAIRGEGGSNNAADDDDPFFGADKGKHPQLSAKVEEVFGDGFQLCPRTALRRSMFETGQKAKFLVSRVEEVKVKTGDDNKDNDEEEKSVPRPHPLLSFRFGFEIEFKLVPRGGESKSSGSSFDDPFNYCSTRCVNPKAPLLDDIASSVNELLSGAGLSESRVEQFHGESGAGCFELVISHASALQAVDALVLTKETIVGVAGAFRGVGGSEGFDVTFLPKPDGPSGAGLGSHVHFSVYDERNNAENVTKGLARKWQERWTRERRQQQSTTSTSRQQQRLTFSTNEEASQNYGESFVAGVFNRLDEIVPFTSCGPTSFMRKKPGCWSGAYKTWGPANKESPLRILGDNVEYKSLDATANPYLAVTAIIAAGWCGVKRRERLPAPPQGDEAKLLVANTEEALAALSSWEQEEGGKGLRPFFCSDLLDTLRSLKRADEVAMRGWSYEETRRRLALTY